MADFSSKFESTKQDWTTPLDLFLPLNAEFNFTLDAAADFNNKLVDKFFDKDTNGLLQDWTNETVWLNPPYGDGSSKLKDWVIKAYNESINNNATSVLLIPARTNTNWFHDYCIDKAEIRFIRGRPKFGGAKYGLPQPLCLIIFRPK